MASRGKKTDIPPTLADAMLSAISPLLVIGMVGSLVFFLVTAFYQGEFDVRLMVILGLFTLATVGIARIAIESGRAHANLFSFPLAVVAYLAMARFVTVTGVLAPLSWLINGVLIGITWYLADRVTMDCTELDDRDAGVRQGLLQSLGLLKRDKSTHLNDNAKPTDDLARPTADDHAKSESKKGERRRKRHNPGVWILYFSLLAIPLFGLGQLVIPEGRGRNAAFTFLVTYLACSLLLLATTAFLSTRRYLRHRGVSMPGEMSGKWLTYAGLGIAGILLISLILPLPGRSLGLVGLPLGFDSPEGLTTSRWAWGKQSPVDAPTESDANGEEANDGQGKAEGEPNDPSGDGKQEGANAKQGERQGNRQGENGNGEKGNDSKGDKSKGNDGQEKSQGKGSPSDNSSQSAGKQQSKSNQKPVQDNRDQDAKGEPANQRPNDPANESAKEKANEQANQQGKQPEGEKRDEQPSEEQRDAPEDQAVDRQAADSPPPASMNSWSNWFPDSLGEMIKWITIAILVVIILIYLVTHPREVAQMWRAFMDFLARLFGGGASSSATASAEAEAKATERESRRPFHAFPNPFSQNLRGWNPEQVVLHTFAALEAWGAEQQNTRGSEETATEFARRLDSRQPRLNKQAGMAASLFDQVMFGGWHPTEKDVEPLAKLWRTMEGR